MSNKIYIKMKEERDLEIRGEEVIPAFNDFTRDAYVCCDGLCTWVGTFDTYQDLMELVGPENLIETIKDNASDIEADELLNTLEYTNYKYTIGYLSSDILVAVDKGDVEDEI